jgi:hypothetical protein
MPGELTDFLVIVLRQIIRVSHRRRGGRRPRPEIECRARRHRCALIFDDLASTCNHHFRRDARVGTSTVTADPPPSSVPVHPRVLERPSSPSPDRLVYQSMEPTTPLRENVRATSVPSKARVVA